MNLPHFFVLLALATFPARALAAADVSDPGQDAGTDRGRAVRLELRSRDPDPAFVEPLREATLQLLAARERPVEEDADTLVIVSVSIDPDDPGSYRTWVDATVADQQGEPRAPTVQTCTGCNKSALQAHLGAQIDAALERLEAARVPTEPAPEPTPALDPTPPPPPKTDAPRAVGRLGITGVALLGTGFAATATGAGLWARGSVAHPDRADWVLRTRPPGIAMVAAGTAGMVAGSVMIALDVRMRRRRADQAVAPLLAPGLAGIAISGRF